MHNLLEVLTDSLVYIGNIHINANVLCKDKVILHSNFHSISSEYHIQSILGSIIIIITYK